MTLEELDALIGEEACRVAKRLAAEAPPKSPELLARLAIIMRRPPQRDVTSTAPTEAA